MIFLYLIYAILFVYFTLGLYWSVMHLEHLYKSNKLSTLNKTIVIPWLVFFLLIDFILNAVIGTILFLEPPRYDKKEWLFTGRVSRLNNKLNWQGKIARWICINLLDPFDSDGKHCS